MGAIEAVSWKQCSLRDAASSCWWRRSGRMDTKGVSTRTKYGNGDKRELHHKGHGWRRCRFWHGAADGNAVCTHGNEPFKPSPDRGHSWAANAAVFEGCR